RQLPRRALTPRPGRAQAVAGIQCYAALAANLEMEVRAFVARCAADVSDHLTAGDTVTLPHGRVVQVGVDGIVPAAVVDQHGRQIQAQRSREADGAGGDRADRRADGRLDADTVARNARVVGTGRRAEGIDDRAPPFHRPIETAEIRRRDRAGPGGDATRLRRATRALERLDAVVERALVLIETGEPLLRLPRVAASFPQVRLSLVLEREVAPQLIGPLAPAPAQRLPGIDEQLALPRHAVAQLVHVIGEEAVLAAHQIEILVAGE